MRDRELISSSIALDLTTPHESEADLEARYIALFERDLFPYEDGLFLVGRLGSSNRLLRRAPELHDQIRAAIAADDDESLIGLADDVDIARQLYTPENEKPINTVFSYTTLLEAIRKHGLSINEAEGRVNALINLIVKRAADSFPEDQLIDATQTIRYISQRLEQLHDETGYTPLETVNMELLSLAAAIFKRLHAHQYIDMFPADSGDTITAEEQYHDTQRISELFQEIRATQSYGVKMGYVGDPRGGTLIFSPPLDPNVAMAYIATPHPLMLQDNSVADVTHSRKKRHSQIKFKATQPLKGLSVVGSTDDLDPIISMSLGEDGELYTDRDCRTALVDIARAKGKYTAYRDMQAIILAHYFDITHTLDEVRQIRQSTGAVNTRTYQPSESPMDSIETLVVPRAMIRHDEAKGATYDAREDTPIRSVRQHNVVWHVRELPEGWHASPHALELAKKLGVTLEPHETIVKEHKRGSRLLGEVTAHRFLQR